MRSGETADAVRLSGELLARADSAWTEARNAELPTTAPIKALLAAAAAHIAALAAAGEPAEAYSTALMVIYMAEIDGSPGIDAGVMSIYQSAIATLIHWMNANRQLAASPEIRNHASTMTRYLASMLYFLYNNVKADTPECKDLPDVYECLRDILGLVQSPVIDVCGEAIDPANPEPLLADLLGRARAIGFLA